MLNIIIFYSDLVLHSLLSVWNFSTDWYDTMFGAIYAFSLRIYTSTLLEVALLRV